MRFWKNVTQLMEARGMTIRALAKGVGVTPGALSNYSRGAVPSLDVAVRIAEVLSVSMDALIWGAPEEPAPQICRSPEEHNLLRELLDELGIEEVIMLSRLGAQSNSWQIALVLQMAFPDAVPADAVREVVPGCSDEVFRASIMALKRQRMIVEEKTESGTSLRLRQPVAQFKVKELGDRTAHVKFATRLLFGKVLPGLLNRDETAHLTTVSATVPRSFAERMSTELHTFVRERSSEIAAENGETGIAVIFGVALQADPG